ncbi:flagellar basal-body rod protein FlgC [Dissulfurispira thermophila]|uniref:Flagellar basal-body rod protein FlgC n=1 Tax=Dissulfurispira thermophila TaxID=2715679 RepID=A0A7G1H3F4_9BACT|nr:flagellar basal body rod protein FlgC [Dissulfurispira thermophila]BCB96476.1 flagellar basal-body rod protein FlgC [Dissulfurispira thermophila]
MKEMFMPLKVSATALEAQKIRMNVIASNIANVNSTRTPEGGPYKRRDVLFESYMFDESSVGVNIPKIVEDQRPFKMVYDPSHPDANKDGYVSYPNINTIEETVNLISATRAYEANLTLINSYKEMFMKTLDITKA